MQLRLPRGDDCFATDDHKFGETKDEVQHIEITATGEIRNNRVERQTGASGTSVARVDEPDQSDDRLVSRGPAVPRLTSGKLTSRINHLKLVRFSLRTSLESKSVS